MNKAFLIIASFSLAFAVILGALGAHALTLVLNQMQLSSFETGVRYHVWHSFGIFLVQLISPSYVSHRVRKFTSWMFLLGIVFFSFSIYLLNLRFLLGIESFAKFFGPVTPFGGLLFIVGWIVLGVSMIRTKSVQSTL